MTAILRGRFSQPGNTAAANTAFITSVPTYLSPRGRVQLDQLQYTTGNIAAAVYLMKPQYRTTLVSAVAAAGTSMTLPADPGLAAPRASAWTSSDYLAVRQTDGSVVAFKASAVNSTTFVGTIANTALPVGASAGARVWFFGVNTDSGHITFPALGFAANTTKNIVTQAMGNTAGSGDLCLSADRIDDPLIVYCPNTTGAASLDVVSGGYVISD